MPDSANDSATLADVARAANVSLGTASRALNGRSGVGTQTRNRIQEAAQRLSYRPNAIARGLVAGRTYTVGLITTDSFGRFSIPIMLGAEDALGAGEISVFLCDGREDPIRERHYAAMLLERRVDGIIVTGRRSDPRTPLGHDLPVPVVYAMTQSTDPEDSSITPDDEQGGQLAAQHLLSTGRRHIAHVTGPERFLAARLRSTGFTSTLQAAGVAPAGEHTFYGEWSESWGRHIAVAILRDLPDLDAVFCGSDQIARGVADSLREAGVRIPDDIALMGFDNWEVIASECRPPLTTVDMNLRQVGQLAAETLMGAIDGEYEAGVQKTPCTLVIRESTRPQATTSR